ncbi:MAG: UDP-3-O-[3-hydroxymyristoyl] N-acetylglucosamine deacetylase [Sneathiella sp.]|jgi:UDP-3-O-[3-hydroxymyristoyl] N-acetylglucosamine deacetylase|uniref:UDP-3-O-acyl-N-acetylglucosamine deacetylase n=1 Tax=Sneathiella sp. TaxID=1964365 RepID=UPI000C6294A7|nr:UDP-3-O-acyl-N-acetylglucosamine deacetylase [Sneathiella sp.]MAL80500.1 UDP-3-O-[3-hydroxymyristoyl] N-acetylglucosamine deacetylase [Sneathiella sp.]|tara:strand:- start:706 stop:1641 length:936 start_codon:yes stop_codon:yes gene_type:complete
MFVNQKTLRNSISCTGVGLHGGELINMKLVPAPANSGIIFRRTDVDAAIADIPARYDSASDLVMCTTVRNDAGVKVATVEHLMAALSGSGIDNLVIELDGPEVPVMDGSAAPFIFLIECADIQEQDAPRRYIKVLKEIEVADGAARAILSPADNISVAFDIDFDNPRIGKQNCSYNLRNGIFKKEISRARTFGFLSDFEQLKKLGLAKGGSLENAIVLSGSDILNEEGLRYDDEFVRHKALDAIGDLYLAGAPIIGEFYGFRSGHALNNKLLHAFLSDRDAWCYTTEAPLRSGNVGGASWPAQKAAAPARD